MDPATTAERLVWLPFEAAELADDDAPDHVVPDGLRVERYETGEPPASIGDVRFWSPAYDRKHDWAGLFGAMTSLEVVQLPSAGYEHVLPHLPDGVVLCSARGVHDAATAEWAMALVLASLRDLPGHVRAQERHEWRHTTRSPSLADSSVLVLGYGSIGAALASRLHAFEADVVPVASRARDEGGVHVHGVDELPELLPHVDVVVVLTPLTEQTRGLVGADFLARMRDGALLVNVARGGVVDTDAVLAEKGRVLAALDVTDPEPLPADHPLWDAPGVLITPHIAGGTTAMPRRLRRLLREQLERYATGRELRNRVSG